MNRALLLLTTLILCAGCDAETTSDDGRDLVPSDSVEVSLDDAQQVMPTAKSLRDKAKEFEDRLRDSEVTADDQGATK